MIGLRKRFQRFSRAAAPEGAETMEPSRIKSYLRSASSLMIGRASSSAAVPPPAAVSPERTGVSDPAPETSVPVPHDEEEDPVAGSTTDDATSVSTENDNADDSHEATSKPAKHYEVTFHQWIHAESDVEVDLKANADTVTKAGRGDTSKQPAQLVDVLLQVDAHGIGINLSVQRRTVGPEANACSRLVVTSFRRLHAHDVGPAEACQQIQVGDELVSIDGEPLHNLERLYGKMKTIRKDSFVLVRFVRRAFEDAQGSESHDSIGSSHNNDNNDVLLEDEVKLLKFDTLLQSNAHAAAVMMRDLVRRNQALQEQLMANKLQQAEQSIQLDQLHALYARTQLDRFPSFSFPKSIRPFVRYPGDSDGTTSSSIAPVVKPSGTLKLHADIELAIHEERIKLRREYAQQLEIEKSKIAKEYADQMRVVQQSMQKKFEMLQAGFQQTIDRHMKTACPYLQQCEHGDDNQKDESESCCAIRRHIQQDLLYHRAQNHIELERDCIACALLVQMQHACENECAVAESLSTSDGMNGQRIHNIVSIIQNYDRMREPNSETSRNEDSGSPACTNQPKVIVQLTPEEDDPLQP